MSSEAAALVPAPLLERFAVTYANFTGGLEWAMQAAPNHPGFAAQAALETLQTKILPHLKMKLRDIEAAKKALAGGDQVSLVGLARESQTLARDLDGYDLNINRTGDFLREELGFLVMAAYQVVSAAETGV